MQRELLPCLHTRFNKLLTAGYFPSSWAEGNIVSLHKKGILIMSIILSVLGKLFTRLLNNRLILGNAVTSQHGALLSDDIKPLKTNR